MKKILSILLIIFSKLTLAQQVNLVIPSGHAQYLESITATSDGKYIASISANTVIIWEHASGKKIHEMMVSASKISSISITDNLERVLISSENSGFDCYNIQTEKKLFSSSNGGYGAKYSKDGTKIFTIYAGILYIFDAETGKEIKHINNVIEYGSTKCKFYELENNRLLILNPIGWAILNIATEETIFKKKLDPDTEALYSYEYNNKDKTIVGTRLRPWSILKFDLNTGANLLTKKHPYNPKGFCINLEGEIIMFSENYDANLFKIEVLRSNDFTVVKTISQPSSEVREAMYYANYCMPLHKTTKIIYNNDNQIFIVDTKEGSNTNAFRNRITDFKNYYNVGNLSQRLTPDNEFSFLTDDKGFRKINLETLRPDAYIQNALESVYAVHSPDGKLTASIGKNVTLISATTGKLIKKIPLPPDIEAKHEFFFFNYDNTKLIYTNREKGNINSIDINTGAVSKIMTLGLSYYECTSSFDGKYFACIVDVNNTEYLKVYNLQTKQVSLNKPSCVDRKQGDCISTIHFLNDSYYIVGLGQKVGIDHKVDDVKVYKSDDPNYFSSFKLPHFSLFSILGGRIKNNILAIGEKSYQNLGTSNIKLVTLDGKILKEFLSINGIYFLKVAISNDGKVMFASTTKKGIQVYSIESGELLGTYYFVEKTNEYIFISPDGLFDGSVDGMKELYFVKNNKPILLDKLYEQFYTPDLLRRKLNGEKFSPPDLSNLHDAPIVSIAYTAIQRNLEIADAINVYQNTTGFAEITVNANSKDDKIDEIRLFHNGKIVNLATRGLFVSDNTNGTDSKKYTINLLAGQNTFRAIALNSQRTESTPDEILVNYQSGNQSNTPIVNANGVPVDAVDKNATMHIIVVGINKYQNDKLSLNYALADATSFKDEIEKDAKSVLANVKTYFVTDNAANKNGITEAFAQVQKLAKPQDIFVFYYAGHGVISEKNKEFYLVPTDVSDLNNVDTQLAEKGIPSKMLQTYAVDIQAQKQLFILDACQSAGAFEKLLTNDANQQKSLAVVARSTGTHWLAASGSQQFANEFATLGHGAFTYVLLNALKGQAAANKMITVNGLKNFLQIGVPDLMKKYGGTAQYPASYGLGNDFPVEVLK